MADQSVGISEYTIPDSLGDTRTNRAQIKRVCAHDGGGRRIEQADEIRIAVRLAKTDHSPAAVKLDDTPKGPRLVDSHAVQQRWVGESDWRYRSCLDDQASFPAIRHD